MAALVPVFNHAPFVGKVVSELKALGAEVFCVDDGSDDDSGAIAAAAGAKVFTQATNQGKGLALQRGFAELNALGWRQVVSVDADGQIPAAAAWIWPWPAKKTRKRCGLATAGCRKARPCIRALGAFAPT